MSNSDEILKRRQLVVTACSAPFWAVINFSSMTLCLIDFKYCFFSSLFYLVFLQTLFSLIELALIILFLINCVYNVYLYVWFKKFMQPLELTLNEYTLFGISEKEFGFKIKEGSTGNQKSPVDRSPKYPSTPPFELSSNSIIDKHSSLDSTALSTRLFDTSIDTVANSWSFIRPTSDSPLKMSNGNITNNSNKSLNNSNNELRFRKSNSFLFKSNSKKSAITSQNDLQRYLDEQEERSEEIKELIQAQKRFNSTNENISSLATPVTNLSMYSPPMVGNSGAGGSSFTSSPLVLSKNHSFNSPHVLNTTPVNNNKSIMLNGTSPEESSSFIPMYQPAIKISTLKSSPQKSEFLLNYSSTKVLEKVLTKLDIDDSRLNQMVENIRKWISQTVLVRLVREIDSINKTITEKGFIDSLIGETTIKQLKHLNDTKKSDFPTLEQVINFLDINIRSIENNITFQQYLVRRIKDLAKGGCMIEFLWDGGGTYNYKHWKDDMITDTEIILHMFCIYMDSRLLFNPTVPEGKPFTSQHFKPYLGSTPKADTYIQQEKSYPPYYSLMLKGERFELPPGRNNLFYALLIFLHHIKVKNFGLLGRINLGPSGLNIAWVINK